MAPVERMLSGRGMVIMALSVATVFGCAWWVASTGASFMFLSYRIADIVVETVGYAGPVLVAVVLAFRSALDARRILLAVLTTVAAVWLLGRVPLDLYGAAFNVLNGDSADLLGVTATSVAGLLFFVVAHRVRMTPAERGAAMAAGTALVLTTLFAVTLQAGDALVLLVPEMVRICALGLVGTAAANFVDWTLASRQRSDRVS